MEIGVIADIHGNKPALDAALTDMPPVDQIICAGDIINYAPWPANVIETLRTHDVTCIRGNHDTALVRVATASNPEKALDDLTGTATMERGIRHAYHTLNEAQRDWLAQLPEERWLVDDRLRMVHSHPDPSQADVYVDPTHVDWFSPHHEGEDILVFGHTHIQHHSWVSETDTLVVNPGSVGQPHSPDPYATYSVVDTTTRTVTEHRVPYDLTAVKQAVSDCQLPTAADS